MLTFHCEQNVPVQLSIKKPQASALLKHQDTVFTIPITAGNCIDINALHHHYDVSSLSHDTLEYR